MFIKTSCNYLSIYDIHSLLPLSKPWRHLWTTLYLLLIIKDEFPIMFTRKKRLEELSLVKRYLITKRMFVFVYHDYSELAQSVFLYFEKEIRLSSSEKQIENIRRIHVCSRVQVYWINWGFRDVPIFVIIYQTRFNKEQAYACLNINHWDQSLLITLTKC